MKTKIEEILEKYSENLSTEYGTSSMGISEHKFEFVIGEITNLINCNTEKIKELILELKEQKDKHEKWIRGYTNELNIGYSNGAIFTLNDIIKKLKELNVN